MKNIKTNDLLELLKADTRQVILETKQLLREDPEILTARPAPGKWSIAQVIEHLNAYGRYYLPALKNGLQQHSYPPEQSYSSGWLGNYFTNSMKPTADKKIKNKMKAMKDYTPVQDLESKTVIDEFLSQQQELLSLLEQAASNNISKIRIPVSIAKFIRIKMGDTFRFLLAHEQRHMVQCANTLGILRKNLTNAY